MDSETGERCDAVPIRKLPTYFANQCTVTLVAATILLPENTGREEGPGLENMPWHTENEANGSENTQ